MKSKWSLVSAIVQLFGGTVAALGFIIAAINGEVMLKWIVIAVLAVSFIALGIIGIIDYCKKR